MFIPLDTVVNDTLFFPDILVQEGWVNVPLAPSEQPVNGACFPDGKVSSPKDSPDKDHRILTLECRVMNSVQVPFDMTVQVAHIRG